MIDNTYQLGTPNALKEKYGFNLQDTSQSNLKLFAMNMMKITLGNLRVLRFGTDGYIWINQFDPPYQVVMHPTRPELEGKSWVFYIENTDKNVYEAFYDTIVANNGAGRVTYNFYKPGTNEKILKISWVRLYEPLGWVIGTGVYVDYIDKIVAEKEKILEKQITGLIYIISIIGTVFILASILILTFFARSITDPIRSIELQLSDMAKGIIVEKLEINRKDEIGQMKVSLDSVIDGLDRYSKFAAEIGKSNFMAEFERLSNKDVLGNSLIGMRNSLASSRKQELKRLEIERRQQWINEGINRIGDIVTISKTIQDLTENVTIKLVDYIEGTHGSIYIINNSDPKNPVLTQMASVAYDRKKFYKKNIDLNEGIVGACYYEKQPINITDIPENYFDVKTGLGTANPKNLYFTPLIFENHVFGVIEISSFSIFDNFTLDLINNVAKLVAVSLSTKEIFTKNIDKY